MCGKCKEFDEKIGLDESSANAFAAAGRFRFLQNHTREHRLVKVPFRESFLHRLKAANPQMSIEQILRIISIAGEEREQGEEEEEEEEEGEEDEDEVDEDEDEFVLFEDEEEEEQDDDEEEEEEEVGERERE